MNRDRYDMLRARAAATVATLAPHQRDWLAIESLMAEVVFQDTLKDPWHQAQILDALASLAPSYATQLQRARQVAATWAHPREGTA